MDARMEENLTVLYVEDDANNRTLIRRVLLAEDFKVVEAASATQAIETVKTLRPDLILMDINMPEMDGYTLTARFKEDPKLYGVPIIALTANVMRGDRERTLEAGCDGYIQKPVDIDILPEQIRQFIKELGRSG
jgi:two-component system cell cycle response regulator DivK